MTRELATRCRTCGLSRGVTLSEMVGRLRSGGMLKARSDASPEVIRELFIASAARLSCGDCGTIGLAVEAAAELDDEAWGQARACQMCGKPIPPERLELLPDARLCAACQANDERGDVGDEREFCPRCGAVMQLVSGRGAGIARYTMRCPTCRR